MVGPSWIDWGFLMEEMDHEEWANFFSRLSDAERARFYYENYLTSENWDEFWENFDEETFIERGIKQGYTREQVVEIIEYSRKVRPLTKEEFERRADEIFNDPKMEEAIRKHFEKRRQEEEQKLR